MRRLHLLTAAAIVLTEALVVGTSPGGRDLPLRSSYRGLAEAVDGKGVVGSGGVAVGSGFSRVEQPAADAPDALYRMALGDPARRNREISPVLDRYLDTHTGDLLTPDALAARLSRTRLLLLGESHTSMEFHRVQLQVLQALVRQGRRVLVGLEMYPYTEQPALDAFGSGALSEAELIDRSRWYEHWGYHWNYYRDIFSYARATGLPLVAVNAPRDIVTAARKNGLGSLAAEDARHLPAAFAPESEDHFAFFKASLLAGDSPHPGMTDDALKGMLAAQVTWDATMGWNAVQALKRSPDPRTIVVVLVGSGHVAYDLGIARQARQWLDDPIASLVPVPLADEHGRPIARVRASYADVIVGVPGERESLYPSLGVAAIAGAGGRAIIDVPKESPGGRAGLQAGDLITALDGIAVTSRGIMNRVMAGKQWGDVVAVTITRGGARQEIAVPLTRTPPD